MTPSNEITLIITGDPAQANSALQKTTSNLAIFEQRALAAGRNSAEALTAFERAALRVAVSVGEIAIAAKAIGAAAADITGVVQGLVTQKSKAEALLDVYRGLRLGIAALTSETAFWVTSGTLGAGLLLEKVLKVSAAYSQLVKDNALAAAQKGRDFFTQTAVGRTSEILGQDISPLLNYGTIEEVSGLLERIRQIQDPVEKARVATERFGKDASLAYSLLNTDVVKLLADQDRLASELDETTRASIGRLRNDLDGFTGLNPFRPIIDALRNLKDEAALGITVKVAAVFDGVRNFRADSTPFSGASIDTSGDQFAPTTTAAPSLGQIRRQFEAVRPSLNIDPLAGGGLTAGVSKFLEDYDKSLEGLKGQLDSTRKKFADLRKTAKEGGPLALGAFGDLKQTERDMKSLEDKIEAITEKERRRREAVQQAAQAEKQASALVFRAYEAQATPLEKINYQLIENLKAYGLTAKAIQEVGKAAEIAFEAELKNQTTKNFEAQQKAQRERDSKAAEARLQAEGEALRGSLELRNRTADLAASYEFKALEQSRDAQLQQLDALDARTTQQKIAVEQTKTQIEQDFIIRRAALEAEQLDKQAQAQIRRFEILRDAQLISEQAFVQNRDAILRDSAERGRQLDLNTQAAIAASKSKADVASIKLLQDNYNQTFDSIKRGVDGVFDQVVLKSKSVFGAVGNIFKTAILSAIKELVSTSIAKQLTAIFAPARAANGPGIGSSTGFGALVRLAGFGGTSSAGSPQVLALPGGAAQGGGFGGLLALPSLGQLGGVNVSGINGQQVITNGQIALGSGGGASGGGLGALSGFGGLFRGGLSSAAIPLLGGGLLLGGLTGPRSGLSSASTISGAALLGSRLGIFGTQLGLVGGAGFGLAADGIRRGGLSGILEAAGGGAIVGARFGGPIGAVIGAAVGAIAAGIRTLFASASDKVRQKIKEIYGVDITSKDILNQVVAIAKQNYGGNLDVAVRSQDVQDLVQLYALSTGQSAKGLKPQMQPLNVSQSGGAVSILSNYSNGMAVNPFTGAAAASTSGATVMQTTIQLDGPSSAAFLQGQSVQAIQQNPRAVAAAANAAQRQNVLRQQSAVDMFAPGLLTS